MILRNYRKHLTAGATFNFVGFYENGKPQLEYDFYDDPGRWEVEQVVERGIVVCHPSNRGHRHLMEWTTRLVKIKFGRPLYPRL